MKPVKDCYRLPLNIGDFVVPVNKRVLNLGISGNINDICKANEVFWIKIFDIKRSRVLEGWYNPSHFTTKERLNERSKNLHSKRH